MKDSNQAMNILEAYDLYQSYNQAARECQCSPNTVPFIMSPLNCLSSSANHRCDGLLSSPAASTCLTTVVRSPLQRHGYDDRDGKTTTTLGLSCSVGPSS